MIRTQVSLQEEEYAAAKAESARLGISLAELLRRSLQCLLPPKDEAAWMRYAGSVQSGDEVALGERPRRQERRRPVGAVRARQEDAVGDGRVEMSVAVEPRAEAVEEGDGADHSPQPLRQ